MGIFYKYRPIAVCICEFNHPRRVGFGRAKLESGRANLESGRVGGWKGVGGRGVGVGW